MSMSTCKCGKVFDSDYQMSHDEKGNCCCDECDLIMYEELIKDLEKARSKESVFLAVYLMNLGYRKAS